MQFLEQVITSHHFNSSAEI